MFLKNSVGGAEGDDASKSESMTRNSPGAFTQCLRYRCGRVTSWLKEMVSLARVIPTSQLASSEPSTGRMVTWLEHGSPLHLFTFTQPCPDDITARLSDLWRIHQVIFNYQNTATPDPRSYWLSSTARMQSPCFMSSKASLISASVLRWVMNSSTLRRPSR